MSKLQLVDQAKAARYQRRRAKLRRPQPPVEYVPFAVPDGASGPDVLRAHLDWLLRNLDHLALAGHATVQTATAALHRDLLLLRMVEPVGKAADAAEPPVFYTLAQRFVAQHERTTQQLVKLMDLLRDEDPRTLLAEWEKLRQENRRMTEIAVEFRVANQQMKQSTGR